MKGESRMGQSSGVDGEDKVGEVCHKTVLRVIKLVFIVLWFKYYGN